MGATPTIRQPGEGERRWFFGGGLHTWKVTGDDSGGSLFLFEDELVEGKNTPWHCHPDSDEVIYLLDGEVRINIDGDEQLVGAGGMWMAPRGVPHAFTVVSATARLLAFQTPGSADRFYLDASEPAGAEDGPVDIARIKATAVATGVTTVLGPPPFARA